MEITINYYGQAVSVSMEVYEYLTQADHKAENLAHEQRRHWDGRECDEYIISTEGRLPYYATPEFLLYALYDFSYAEIGRLCGCSKSAVEKSVSAVKNVFKKFWK